MTPVSFASNHAGGILGGISSGQDIVVSMALKPTSSITVPGKTITTEGEATEMITKGRHDPCVGIRAVPIAEAMLALVLMDHLLRHRAQNQGVLTHTRNCADRPAHRSVDRVGQTQSQSKRPQGRLFMGLHRAGLLVGCYLLSRRVVEPAGGGATSR